ncbi:hypothetical protein HanPI659440_Chr15g0577271 [Helianthus annuus]|nr:hypothetical protein HanPI659440_Chr15g0577271 [Helianthus annuus]
MVMKSISDVICGFNIHKHPLFFINWMLEQIFAAMLVVKCYTTSMFAASLCCSHRICVDNQYAYSGCC